MRTLIAPATLRLAIGFMSSILPVSAYASDSNALTRIASAPSEMDTYLPDYSYAGYNYGVGEIPTVVGTTIDVTEFGVEADDDIDDSKALISALEKAHSVNGPVIVELPAGKVIVTEILKIERGDIVLRGAGSGKDGTVLFFPRPLQMVDKSDKLAELRTYLKKYDKRQREKAKNIDELFSEYSWSGGLIWVQKPGTRAASYLENMTPRSK